MRSRLRPDGRSAVIRLATRRLLLQPLLVEHAALFAALFAGDREAVGQTGRMPWPPTVPALRDWLAGHVPPASHSFLIVRRRDHAALGGIGFGGEGAVAELGYALGRAHWGRGYATKAVRAMIGHAHGVGFAGLEAFSFVENPASARVLEKAGFVYCGVIRRNYPERGGVRRVRHYRKWLEGGTGDGIPQARP